MPSSLTVPKLTLRLEKGAKLTAQEVDADFTILRDFCNNLASLLGIALNTDGSINQAVVGQTQLLNRAVTAGKLAANALRVLPDLGSGNAYKISPRSVESYSSADPPPTLDLDDYDGGIFFIESNNISTGPATLQIDALAPLPLRKMDNRDIEAGDVKIGMVFCVSLDVAAGVFHLLAGSGTGSTGGTSNNSSSTTNFTGLTVYTSGEGTIPANAAAAPASFAHALNEYPNTLHVWLKCKTAEFGYQVDDVVPIDEFTLADGTPAFTVKASRADIKVYANSATIKVQDHITTGALATITTANWKIVVRAQRVFPETSRIFPAQEFTVARPCGGVCYGNNLYYINRGITSDLSRAMKIDLSTGNAAASTTGSGLSLSAFSQARWTQFRLADGKDYLFMASLKGLHRIAPDGTSPWSTIHAVDLSLYTLIYLDESPPGGTTYYLARSRKDDSGVQSKVGGHYFYKQPNSSGYTTPTVTGMGAPVDYNHTSVVNGSTFRSILAASNPTIEFFQYNPLKRRLYFVDNEQYLLHIFNLSLYTSANIADWLASAAVGDLTALATRATKLTYEKSLAIPGDTTLRDNDPNDCMAIEWDLTSGAERSILISRYGNGVNGSLIRTGWYE